MIISKPKAGRFCNILIRDLSLYWMSKKLKINIKYEFTFNKFNVIEFYKKLGIYNTLNKNLYDNNLNKKNINIDENQLLKLLSGKIEIKRDLNYIFCSGFLQDPELILKLGHFLKNSDIKKDIINNNKFKDRYKNKNDLVIHIRCGDAVV